MRVLWFKRDLRISDHLPLLRCSEGGSFVAIYVYEPKVIASPEYGSNQHEFINDCLDDLACQLEALGGQLLRLHGHMRAVLSALHAVEPITELHSHMETGNTQTHRRDWAVAEWCRRRGVLWHEAPTSDMVRPHPNRDGWSKRWYQQVRQLPVPTPKAILSFEMPPLAMQVDDLNWQAAGLEPPAPQRQQGGRGSAEVLLKTFLREKTGRYTHQLSSPVTASAACSRLSPHLAVGSLSSREVIFKLDRARRLVTNRAVRKAYDAFESRMAWRGHFMQRLEDDMSIENQCLDPAMESVRQPGARLGKEPMTQDEITRRFDAWKAGRTGFPMVDACVRSLRETGWLNFRMRAMIVSFACYTLWLDWRLINPWLARQFTDYEPGIHLNQLQMQSGSTGINQLRIYNPVMQAEKHDPSGSFIRQWVPELAGLSTGAIHRLGGPHVHGLFDLHGVDYPEPIVNLQQANRFARGVVTRRRQTSESRRAARDVNHRLGSRKNRGPTRGRK